MRTTGSQIYDRPCTGPFPSTHPITVTIPIITSSGEVIVRTPNGGQTTVWPPIRNPFERGL
jgi:hypothetical protein